MQSPATLVEVTRDVYSDNGITKEVLESSPRIYGLKNQIRHKSVDKLGVRPKLHEINRATSVVRGQILTESFGKFKTRAYEPVTDQSFLAWYCRTNNIFRNSRRETGACRMIVKHISSLPVGGHAMIVGSATPVCVYNPKKYNSPNGEIITDNLWVAEALESTSDSLEVVVGDAVRPEAAACKITLWQYLVPRLMNTLHGVRVSVGRISGGLGDSYEQIIKKQCEQNTICKVVLLGSGVWTGSHITASKFQAYGIDPDFKSPSIALTKQFPGLHILAMVRSGDRHNPSGASGYEIYHVHNGIERNLNTEGYLQ